MSDEAMAAGRSEVWLLCVRWLCCLMVALGGAGCMADSLPGVKSPGAISSLSGPWRFHVGDDPRWADPTFDDSSWAQVRLDIPISEQGIDPYSGYGWYRLRLTAQQLVDLGFGLDDGGSKLLVTPRTVGQVAVYENGFERGRTKGMSDSPRTFISPPLPVGIAINAADGGVFLAIRTWADVPIHKGILENVQLGPESQIADRLELAADRQWNKEAASKVLAGFLFLCVAGFSATLYLTQKNHLEYLFLSLLCLVVAIRGGLDAALDLEMMSLFSSVLIGAWMGWFFMLSTLEFVYRFTGSNQRRLVRGAQIAGVLVPIAHLLQLERIAEYVNVIEDVGFLALVGYLLFRSWRGGRLEAGIMLIPFTLAAIGDSGDTVLQLAIEHHWLPEKFTPHPYRVGLIEFNNSTAAYLLFLASLVAVILYRFVHVSELEQRSAAEMDAARSVQALLIPTQLPSSRNFSLDSAYLPVNGVGGDFFQVLPLKDDSILLVVGDVSGKGLQAAMNASTLVGALRNELSNDPATILAHLNLVMLGASSGPIAGFATCLCARVYPSGRMVIANAGHLSPYRDGREMELAPDLPLGIVPGIPYEQAEFQLKHGDRLIFLSDGVVEATSASGELFGFERTQHVSHEPALYIAQTAQRFGQNDDITVVSLYFVPA